MQLGDTVYFNPNMVQGNVARNTPLIKLKPRQGELVGINQITTAIGPAYRYTVKEGYSYYELLYAVFYTEDDYIEYLAKEISKKPNNMQLLITAIKNLFS